MYLCIYFVYLVTRMLDGGGAPPHQEPQSQPPGGERDAGAAGEGDSEEQV